MEGRVTPQCPGCRVELDSLGQVPVRTGGTSGGWLLVFREWAEAGEDVLSFDAYRCPQCSRLEFYDHDFSLPHR